MSSKGTKRHNHGSANALGMYPGVRAIDDSRLSRGRIVRAAALVTVGCMGLANCGSRDELTTTRVGSGSGGTKATGSTQLIGGALNPTASRGGAQGSGSGGAAASRISLLPTGGTISRTSPSAMGGTAPVGGTASMGGRPASTSTRASASAGRSAVGGASTSGNAGRFTAAGRNGGGASGTGIGLAGVPATGGRDVQPQAFDSCPCVVDLDCPSYWCHSGQCAKPSCSDGIHNGTETDLDCGGRDCAPCPLLRNCQLSSDCALGDCDSGRCLPVGTGSCIDGIRNGDETDIDTGGRCTYVARPCTRHSDCELPWESCLAGVCTPASCDDGVRNSDETDVDCGGMWCEPCAVAKKCQWDTDCQSRHCETTQARSWHCGGDLGRCTAKPVAQGGAAGNGNYAGAASMGGDPAGNAGAGGAGDAGAGNTSTGNAGAAGIMANTASAGTNGIAGAGGGAALPPAAPCLNSTCDCAAGASCAYQCPSETYPCEATCQSRSHCSFETSAGYSRLACDAATCDETCNSYCRNLCEHGAVCNIQGNYTESWCLGSQCRLETEYSNLRCLDGASCDMDVSSGGLDCYGSACQQTCSGGCRMECADAARCQVRCGGGCYMTCSSGADCVIDSCSDGGCSQDCLPGATCTIKTCAGGGCHLECHTGSQCSLEHCEGASCNVTCHAGATCSLGTCGSGSCSLVTVAAD
jgi:hypothetical protein